MNNKSCVVQLQELADKVFPAYNRDSVEAQFNKAVDVCLNFQPCNPNTTSDQWIELDWALTVPGVAEEFPELVDAIKQHFSITMSYNDLSEVIRDAMRTAIAVYQDFSCAESQKDLFNQYSNLPEEVCYAVNTEIDQITAERIRVLKDLLDNIDNDEYWDR